MSDNKLVIRLKDTIRMGYIISAPGLNGGLVTVGQYRTATHSRAIGNWAVIDANNAVECFVWPQDATARFVELVGEDAARQGKILNLEA